MKTSKNLDKFFKDIKDADIISDKKNRWNIRYWSHKGRHWRSV